MPASSGASRRTVSVLFCDIVDSTPLGERLDPEAWRRLQTGYFDAVRGVLERHGATVEKYIGDAVMAVFGLPALHEDDALRALRAASELRAAVAPLDQEVADHHGLRLRLRVGVATGEVVTGDATDGQRFATGDTVITAQRLESAARPSEVLISDATYLLATGAAIVEPVEPVPAKGFAEPVTAWRLVGVQATAPATPRRLDLPLVGRREELARLRAGFDLAVAERHCRLVAVLGPAGIGKSRLALELLNELQGEASALVGRCPPYGEGITFWPVREIFPDERFEGTTADIFRRLRRRIEERARRRPLVICFDDVHWAEPTLLSLIDYLAGWIADAPVLLLCLARADLLEHGALPGAERIGLTPLAAAESAALAEVLGAPEEARSRIVEAAEGNPLFVEQMTAMAAEEGADFAVPPSIRALLAARLDRLPQAERTAVQIAATVGPEFPLEAVAALADDDVAEPLLSLVRKELLRPHTAEHDDGFRFRHALIREAAYDATPKAVRAQLHERHGRWLAEGRGDGVLVGYHLEQAYRLRRELGRADDETLALGQEAGTLLGAAGERAFRRDDVPAAVSLLGRAVDLLRPSGPNLPTLATELAGALLKAGRFDAAEQALDDALATAVRLGDRRAELRALIERQQVRSFAAPSAVDESARIAAEAIPELEELEDHLGLAKAWRLASEVHGNACRWQARAEALERALTHARQVPDAHAEVNALVVLLAQALHYGPTPAPEAIETCAGLLDGADDHPSLVAGVGATMAALLAAQGRFEEAREHYRRSVALQEELGLRLRRAIRTLEGAEIEVLAGDLAAAERELRTGYDLLEGMGESGVRAVVAAYLAAVLCQQERDDEAQESLAVAAEIAEADDLASQIVQQTTRARLLARRGELEHAESLARDALDLAAATDFPSMQADASIALAEVLGHARREAEAREHLERAREIYERKGNLCLAGRLADAVSRAALGSADTA